MDKELLKRFFFKSFDSKERRTNKYFGVRYAKRKFAKQRYMCYFD